MLSSLRALAKASCRLESFDCPADLMAPGSSCLVQCDLSAPFAYKFHFDCAQSTAVLHEHERKGPTRRMDL